MTRISRIVVASVGTSLASVAVPIVLAVPSEAKELTRTQWVAAADKVCAKLRADTTKRIVDSGLAVGVQEGTPEEAAYLKKVAPIVADYLSKNADEIAKLQAPKADRTKIQRMLTALRAASSKLRKDPTLVGEPSITDPAKKLAGELGLKNCGAS